VDPMAKAIAAHGPGAGVLMALLLAAPPALPEPGELLPPERAFRAEAERIGPDRVRIAWRIAEGYYLYRDRIAVRVSHPEGVSVAIRDLSQGARERDALSGEWRRVLRKGAILTAQLDEEPGTAFPLRIEVRYQGCAENRLCYSPQRRTFALLPEGSS